jgi:hypothetical protein
VEKNTPKKAHNTHANQKKNFLKHMPEPVLLLSLNRSCLSLDFKQENS